MTDRHVGSDSAALPPGSRLGNTRQTARWVMRPLSFLEELREQHGDVFTIQLANENPWVIVGDPDEIKRIFAAPPDVLHAGEGNAVLRPIFGSSALLLQDEERHMQRRRMLLPPFHGDRVRSYGDTMRRIAAEHVERWPTGEEAPVWPLTQALSLEAIARVVVGEPADGLDPLLAAMSELRVPSAPGASDEPGFRSAIQRAHDVVLAEIAHRRSGAGTDGRDDVLALLLDARDEQGEPLADDEVCNEIVMLLVTGHETTATALAWALERLARTPAALERATADARADDGGSYIEAVIQETLRMRPPLPMAARLVKRPFAVGEHLIPAGATIVPSVLLLHHRPDIYPDPSAFRPERFLERPPGTYTWIPFGGGIRRCIGASFALLEMRVVLAELLARLDLHVDESAGEPMRTRAVTLVPAQGARLAFTRRRV